MKLCSSSTIDRFLWTTGAASFVRFYLWLIFCLYTCGSKDVILEWFTVLSYCCGKLEWVARLHGHVKEDYMRRRLRPSLPSPSCLFHKSTSKTFLAVNITALLVPFRITVGAAPDHNHNMLSSIMMVRAQCIGPLYLNSSWFNPLCCWI